MNGNNDENGKNPTLQRKLKNRESNNNNSTNNNQLTNSIAYATRRFSAAFTSSP